MLFDDEDDEPKVSNDFDNGEVQYEVVTVGDQTRIKDICDNILGHIQEATLKKILKEWIKKVHPKKQSLYPYNGGKAKEPDKTKPPWWPEDLRHKEPDHLKKLGWPDQKSQELLSYLLNNREKHAYKSYTEGSWVQVCYPSTEHCRYCSEARKEGEKGIGPSLAR